MTLFLLLTNHGGSDVPPMTEWDPADINAHLECLRALNAELAESGELVEMRALAAPELAKRVTSDGVSSPVVTDGPYPEAKEVLAGYQLLDVESEQRALEIAARVSAAPGPGGAPIRQTIEVRQVMFFSSGLEM
jgi:hypothetical protein